MSLASGKGGRSAGRVPLPLWKSALRQALLLSHETLRTAQFCRNVRTPRGPTGRLTRAHRRATALGQGTGSRQDGLNPTQRNRSAALLKSSGFEDSPALTVQSTDGEIPHGRELSFAWLTGTVMTGLTSVLLMGAALYVSFEGQDTFSTAYEALQLITRSADEVADSEVKGNRLRPVARTRSEL